MSENKIAGKKEKSLEITKTYDLEKPVEAVQMADLLKKLVIQQNLYVNIKGKNYAMVDGWQLAGFLTGMNVMVDEPKNISATSEIKYSATARIFKGEKLVGIGYALCSSKEATKKGFDEYAILSMSQTRAIGKAYRNKIGFIMKLAGFQSTPGEEMVKVDQTPPEPVTAPISQYDQSQMIKKGQVIGPEGIPTWICAKCKDPISETVYNYSTKLYGKGLCREDQKSATKK